MSEQNKVTTVGKENEKNFTTPIAYAIATATAYGVE